MNGGSGAGAHAKAARRLFDQWRWPVAAGLSMFIPVQLWDLAAERELSSQAIRNACLKRGYSPTPGEVAACNSAIVLALTRGHRASWAINAVSLAGYLGGPAVFSAAVVALISYLTQRIVDDHVRDHASLAGFDEHQARHLITLHLRALAARRVAA